MFTTICVACFTHISFRILSYDQILTYSSVLLIWRNSIKFLPNYVEINLVLGLLFLRKSSLCKTYSWEISVFKLKLSTLSKTCKFFQNKGKTYFLTLQV